MWMLELLKGRIRTIPGMIVNDYEGTKMGTIGKIFAALPSMCDLESENGH